MHVCLRTLATRCLPWCARRAVAHGRWRLIRALAHAGIPQFAVGTASSYATGSRWHRPLDEAASEASVRRRLAECVGRVSDCVDHQPRIKPT